MTFTAMKALAVRQLEFRDGIPHDDVDALARAAISGQAALRRSRALVRIVQETNVVAGHDRAAGGVERYGGAFGQARPYAIPTAFFSTRLSISDWA
jgi:hypothetical protein